MEEINVGGGVNLGGEFYEVVGGKVFVLRSNGALGVGGTGAA